MVAKIIHFGWDRNWIKEHEKNELDMLHVSPGSGLLSDKDSIDD